MRKFEKKFLEFICKNEIQFDHILIGTLVFTFGASSRVSSMWFIQINHLRGLADGPIDRNESIFEEQKGTLQRKGTEKWAKPNDTSSKEL